MLEEQVFDDEPDMKRRASVTLANCPGGMNMYKEVLKRFVVCCVTFLGGFIIVSFRHTTQDIRVSSCKVGNDACLPHILLVTAIIHHAFVVFDFPDVFIKFWTLPQTLSFLLLV